MLSSSFVPTVRGRGGIPLARWPRLDRARTPETAACSLSVFLILLTLSVPARILVSKVATERVSEKAEPR